MRADTLITPVILCGGSGKRLWPLSRAASPKQFLPLAGSETLLQSTALRVARRAGFGPMIVVAGDEHRSLVAEQLGELEIAPPRIVLEPVGRNTAPAAAVAAILATAVDPAALLLLMPADHVIGDNDAFLSAIDAGVEAARAGEFVLFGIHPDRPATGYGYIEFGERLDGPHPVHRVRRFVEKPPRPLAEQYLASGNFAWNSGIFLLPAGAFLAEMERLAPDVLAVARKAVKDATVDADFLRLDPTSFGTAPSISIDHAVFEKTDRAVVVRADMKWSDIGSWSALWDIAAKDAAGNVALGAVIAEKTSNSYLRTDGPLVATIGLANVIVIATGNIVLIADRAHDQEVKQMAERIEKELAEQQVR
jgi:mannose-1-phosphate guanylyltransferase/mannose-1-phosphate guanylyltransferase/mannose-6-phosphate isomerase